MADYQVIIIGAGPAGYVAAIRCAQLGMKVACVEKWIDDTNQAVLGGTCLNVGCIPSKVLLDSSYHYEFAKNHAAEHGIEYTEVSLNLTAMHQRKNKAIHTLTKGIADLFKKNKVTQITGQARLLPNKQVAITTAEGHQQVITTDNIIIATGSSPTCLPFINVDEKYVLDSTGALNLQRVYPRIGIIGAGAIGLELGSVWQRLGSQVTILEAQTDFLPQADKKIAATAKRTLTKQGLSFQFGAQVNQVDIDNGEVTVKYKMKDEDHVLIVDRLIIAVGRSPNTADLNLAEIGVKLTDGGFIEVDEHCQTSIGGIYAIGDVIGGAMLAHKAFEEGVFVAEHIAKQHPRLEKELMPWIIYTHPEIAWVGQTEETLKAQGIDYKVGQFPFAANGRAYAQGETTGLVRILADAETDRILGVHIFGATASELMAEAVTAMAFEASSEDLASIIHAHPTLSEGIHEAALAVTDKMIHA